MAGDVKEVFNNPKILNLGHTLVAAAGDAGFTHYAQEALADAAESPLSSALVLGKWMREQYLGGKLDMDILVVNSQQQLTLIDCRGCQLEVKGDFYCIGSGGEIARAYLMGLTKGDLPTVDQAKAAIAYTASRLAGVNDRMQVEYLGSAAG